MEKIKSFSHYIAAACFLIIAIRNFKIQIDMYSIIRSFVLTTIIGIIGVVIVAVGLAIRNNIIAGCGSILFTITKAIELFMTIDWLSIVPLVWVNYLLDVVFAAVLAVAFFKKDFLVKGAYAACAVEVLHVIIFFINMIFLNGGKGSFGLFLSFALYIAGAYFVSMFSTGAAKTVTADGVAVNPVSGDTADRLLELHGLLRSGILTQDEFDEKKKQILN